MIALMAVCEQALAFDPLMTGGAIPATPAAPAYGDSGAGICVFGDIPTPLELRDAVERALCDNPKTREAWGQVKVKAAEVGIGRAAYLPTVSADVRAVHDQTVTNVTGLPQYSSNYRNPALRTESVTLSWVLYDFGGRRAALDNANALLAAAQATQDQTLDETFGQVAKDYYAAQAAQGAFRATQSIQEAAQKTFDAAKARVDHGVAPISDQLQAQTSLAQAAVNTTKARGDLATALGTLAVDMGTDPNLPYELPPVESGVRPDAMFKESVGQLMDDAKATYPSVLAAQAQLDAAALRRR